MEHGIEGHQDLIFEVLVGIVDDAIIFNACCNKRKSGITRKKGGLSRSF